MLATGVMAGADPPGWTPERRDFFMDPLMIEASGELVVPDAPGLGVRIGHGAVALYGR